MPRSRGSEMPPQRQSPRGLSQLRTSSSDSDSSHPHRPVTERSPKPSLTDRRSSPRSDASSQKKLGTRIADLESQLGQAQEELKCLKDQLASAEAAKRAAQQLLQNKPTENQESNKAENQSFELDSLRAKLEEKEEEVEKFNQENKSVNLLLNEKLLEVSSAKAKEEETALKLNQVLQELEATKSNAARVSEKLDNTEKAKEELETEMKKLRVQTEQWRKAADAAAAVFSEGRIGSMDTHYSSSVFEPGYGSYLGSPGLIGENEGFGSGKRKSSGIKMFNLWKKKNQK